MYLKVLSFHKALIINGRHNLTFLSLSTYRSYVVRGRSLFFRSSATANLVSLATISESTHDSDMELIRLSSFCSSLYVIPSPPNAELLRYLPHTFGPRETGDGIAESTESLGDMAITAYDNAGSKIMVCRETLDIRQQTERCHFAVV